MTWLRRSLRLGKRFGEFVLTISIRKIGRIYEARAAFTTCRRSVPAFDCRVREHDWEQAFRQLTRELTLRIHDRRILLAQA